MEINRNEAELEETKDVKLKGSFIRSRSKSYLLEKKYILFKYGNNNFVSKNINDIKNDNNNTITNPEDNLEEIRTFSQNCIHINR